MDLDEQTEDMEDLGETEAEWTDQETELEDFEGDEDEILGVDTMESDLESTYDSFSTNNETDFDGFNDGVPEGTDGYVPDMDDTVTAENEQDGDLASEGYEIEDDDDLEAEVIEMEIEDGDIYAVIVDEDDNEIGFVLLDDDGNQQEYYYVTDDDQEDEDGEDGVEVIRASDEREFDLDISREGVTAATQDMNAIYREGAQVVGEFKSVADEIKSSFDFLKNPLG
ncbi:MAG: hypothetical protein HFJ66_03650 [Eggerthellaceae bacterium]|nr:hypothetical protein [Eggerthellaceae bacterium]